MSARDARGLSATGFSAAFPPCASEALRNRRKKAKRPVREEVKTQKMLRTLCKIRRGKDIPNPFLATNRRMFGFPLPLRGFFVCDGARRLAMLSMFFGIRLSGSMPPIRRIGVKDNRESGARRRRHSGAVPATVSRADIPVTTRRATVPSNGKARRRAGSRSARQARRPACTGYLPQTFGNQRFVWWSSCPSARVFAGRSLPSGSSSSRSS